MNLKNYNHENKQPTVQHLRKNNADRYRIWIFSGNNLSLYKKLILMTAIEEIINAALLKTAIGTAIHNIDTSMSVTTFAHSVALILEDFYGEHNYETFLNELKTKLK